MTMLQVESERAQVGEPNASQPADVELLSPFPAETLKAQDLVNLLGVYMVLGTYPEEQAAVVGELKGRLNDYVLREGISEDEHRYMAKRLEDKVLAHRNDLEKIYNQGSQRLDTTSSPSVNHTQETVVTAVEPSQRNWRTLADQTTGNEGADRSDNEQVITPRLLMGDRSDRRGWLIEGAPGSGDDPDEDSVPEGAAEPVPAHPLFTMHNFNADEKDGRRGPGLRHKRRASQPVNGSGKKWDRLRSPQDNEVMAIKADVESEAELVDDVTGEPIPEVKELLIVQPENAEPSAGATWSHSGSNPEVLPMVTDLADRRSKFRWRWEVQRGPGEDGRTRTRLRQVLVKEPAAGRVKNKSDAPKALQVAQSIGHKVQNLISHRSWKRDNPDESGYVELPAPNEIISLVKPGVDAIAENLPILGRKESRHIKRTERTENRIRRIMGKDRTKLQGQIPNSSHKETLLRVITPYVAAAVATASLVAIDLNKPSHKEHKPEPTARVVSLPEGFAGFAAWVDKTTRDLQTQNPQLDKEAIGKMVQSRWNDYFDNNG